MDLLQFFDCTEVEVLFTLIVTEELVHYQWDHPVPELRQQTKETIKQVEKWLEGQRAIGPGVAASFLGSRPDSETMKRHGLNWQHQNELLLGVILEYKQAHAAETVILLTGDNDLALQARSLGIEPMVLSSEYALTGTKNTLQAGRQKLRRELAGLRYRRSSLSLSFTGGKDELTVTIAPQLDSLPVTMQAQLVAVADNMHREAAQQQGKNMSEAALDDLEALAALAVQASPAGGRSFLGRMVEEEAKRYQRELEAYPERFERYLGRCLEMINEHRRTIRLDLEMKNAGGTQAENVLLVLTVPEQLEWYWQPSESDMPAPPVPPTPPGPEGQRLEKGFHIGRVSSVPSHLLNRDYISGEEPAGASPVMSEAGTKLEWELGTYRHHQSRLLGSPYVRFRRAEDIANFTIAYEIQERYNPGSVREKLLVFVEVAQEITANHL